MFYLNTWSILKKVKSKKGERMKRILWMIVGVMLMGSMSSADETMPKELKEKAISVINLFVKTLRDNSYEKSAQLVVPFMQKSLLDNTEKKLDNDTYRYQFKKAYNNVHNYHYPVQITRVQTLKTSSVGYGKSFEKGVEYKLWIAKQEGVSGMPAPLVVFVKEKSNDIQLSYVGSL